MNQNFEMREYLMQIVSWNCNGAFRNKFVQLSELNADIYIVQECENPDKTNVASYKEFANNHIWIGHGHKGLGIFASDSISLKNNSWPSYGLEYFLSCSVDDQVNLLGIWGCTNYIEDIHTYVQIHKDKLKNSIVGGDFNSNAIWDKGHKRRNHSVVVNDFEYAGLVSAYHTLNREVQGCETQKAFYLYKHKPKSYHIDYFFSPMNIIKSMTIGNYEKWNQYSDHVPILLEISV